MSPTGYRASTSSHCHRPGVKLFPNILGEAMACRHPLRRTPISAIARSIIGRHRPDRSPPVNIDAMAAALLRIATLGEGERANMGAAARERVVSLFELRHVALQYRRLCAAVLDRSFAPYH